MQKSGFQLWQLMLFVFNIACLLLAVRFSYTVRWGYQPIELVLAMVGSIAFSIGMSFLNRGSFSAMVSAFVFCLAACSTARWVSYW